MNTHYKNTLKTLRVNFRSGRDQFRNWFHSIRYFLFFSYKTRRNAIKFESDEMIVRTTLLVCTRPATTYYIPLTVPFVAMFVEERSIRQRRMIFFHVIIVIIISVPRTHRNGETFAAAAKNRKTSAMQKILCYSGHPCWWTTPFSWSHTYYNKLLLS